ncbi:MAG TPA: FAD-dependent oxidoreductase [Bryobacteraceae bacterium]|nr:FAD-dependent oxidoreductase [Bryobacteraceae bacterium]
MQTDYDLVVIGGGAGGLTAAGMAALLGAKTALIERDQLGGECTWTGCVPSKCLIRAASIAHTMRTAEQFGFEPVVPKMSLTAVFDRMRAIQQQIYEEADAPPNMEKLGVEVIRGSAAFVDPHTITVDGKSIRSRFFVIATGSAPRRPAFDAAVLTNETIFELTAQPGHLVVVGAGPVGVELAQAFRRLGSEVSVVAAGPEILPKDDRELAATLREGLQAEGIRFFLETRASAATNRGSAIQVRLSNNRLLDCDTVLAATGREVSTGPLRLDLAGVQATDRGIVVDKQCRTSASHIYAVGDVTGQYLLTHMAEHMAKVAITNCLLRWPRSIDRTVPWCTFTSPELAHTGCREQDCKQGEISVLRHPFRHTDRAVIDGEVEGTVKVVIDKRGRVLGASILGPDAGELIQMWSLAVRQRLNVADVAGTIHPYPTYSLANRKAADRWEERWLDSSTLKLVGRLLGYRGVSRGSSALHRQ